MFARTSTGEIAARVGPMRSALLILLLAGGAAAAPGQVAVAVNCPCWWPGGNSVAGSLYVGATAQDAIRLNIASYRYTGSAVADIVDGLAGGDGDEGSYSGRTTDFGIAWTSYSRRLWDGFTYELGLLQRKRDLRDEDEFASPQILETHTTVYAARAQIGWSWTLGSHAFVAVAAGLAMGWERGTQTTDSEYDPMPVTTDVSRARLSGEGYLRFGIVP